MTKLTLPHFGQIDLTSLKDYYEADVKLSDSEIQVDLNFTDSTIDIQTMELVGKFINDIDKFDKQNKIHIKEDYDNEKGETVNLYLEHHLSEIDESELADLIDFDNEESEPKKQLLSALKLVRVGLYPQAKRNFAVFDYTIGRELTDYLVVINLNKEGEIQNMEMES
jgi:hypothetical protein